LCMGTGGYPRGNRFPIAPAPVVRNPSPDMAVVECKFEIMPGTAEALEEQIALSADARWTVWDDRLAGRMWATGYFGTRGEARDAYRCLAKVIEPERMAKDPAFRALPEADWAESYRVHFKAWRIGRRHWVPKWERESCRIAPGREIVWLDPGMAFGTGNHESTRLCCERLVQYVDAYRAETRSQRRGCRIIGDVRRSTGVIDVGCGSGILGISAARFGLGPVVGFDNDPIAVRVSRENAALNQVANRIEFFAGDLATALGGRQAGLVVANIHTDVLRKGARDLLEAVAPGGWLALSGILASEIDDLRADFLALARGISMTQTGQGRPIRRSNDESESSIRRGKAPGSSEWKADSRRLGEWADLLLIRRR
jgi:ribosomal protein L11 methyltransferase